MTSVLRRIATSGALAIGVLAISGCADSGQIEITNNTEEDVNVKLEGEAVDEVSGNGGALIYTNECYDGPIVVTYADTRSVDLVGPLCPGQEILIDNESAKLQGLRTN